MDELAFLPATEQARLVREGEVSPVELVEGSTSSGSSVSTPSSAHL